MDAGLDEWRRGAGDAWPPGEEELWQWCSGRLELISRLRAAAGMAKVPAAAEIVAEAVGASGAALDGGYANPLVVWTHHRAVTEAMRAAARSAMPDRGSRPQVAAIMGGTPDADRERFVSDFAAGRLAALVCSITAAGVGITLTRASEAIFVEADWTPAVVVQAEDRIWRIGQDRPVTVTTLLAEGTLDEAVQATLVRKAGDLDKVMAGGDHHVAVANPSGRSTATRLLVGLVSARLGQRPRRRRETAA